VREADHPLSSVVLVELNLYFTVSYYCPWKNFVCWHFWRVRYFLKFSAHFIVNKYIDLCTIVKRKCSLPTCLTGACRSDVQANIQVSGCYFQIITFVESEKASAKLMSASLYASLVNVSPCIRLHIKSSDSVARVCQSWLSHHLTFVCCTLSLPSLEAFKRALKAELLRRSYSNAHYWQQQRWH